MDILNSSLGIQSVDLEEFYNLVIEGKRREAIDFSLHHVDRYDIPLVDYYEHVLAPVMHRLDECKSDLDYILKEHLRSAVVRAIIENLSFRFVERDRRSYLESNLKEMSGSAHTPTVLLYAPTEEYHDLGLRMAEDIFEINGCKVIYPGPNFPKEELLVALSKFTVDVFVMSITTPYNLVVGHKTCAYLISHIPEKNFEIYCAGAAFKSIKGKMLSEEVINMHINGILDTLYDVERVARELHER